MRTAIKSSRDNKRHNSLSPLRRARVEALMQILRYERVLYLDKEGQHLLAEDGLAGASLTKAIDDAVNAGLVRLNVLDGIVRVHLVEGEVSA